MECTTLNTESVTNDTLKMLNCYIIQYRDSLVNVSSRITNDRAGSEDIVQDVCLSLVSTADQFRGQSSPKTYLYRIVVNRSIDFVRKAKRTKVVFDTILNEHDNQESRPDYYEIKDLTRKLLSTIPNEFKVPLTLAEIEGMSYEEISGILNISLNTVRSRIFRCRERLKKEFKKLGIEP